jgi:hypothetical protein
MQFDCSDCTQFVMIVIAVCIGGFIEYACVGDLDVELQHFSKTEQMMVRYWVKITRNKQLLKNQRENFGLIYANYL